MTAGAPAPCDLTAREAAARLADGRLTAETLVRSCLDRIAAREPEVQAWQAMDPDRALAQAREMDARGRPGPLHGLPIGVKDLMATTDLPTTCGSPIYDGTVLPYDAACVALARMAGAVVMGKTVTTEFAAFHPGKTRNPRNPAHTPGGSSSGSAAAVAAGMVPLAFGTQTAGSVIRPAAFCGVVGYKPTFGTIETAGVKALAPALDTIGVFARTVCDAGFLVDAVTGTDRPVTVPDTPPTVWLCPSPVWSAAEPDLIQAWDAVVEGLGRATRVETLTLPDAYAEAPAAQERIMAYQAFRALAHEWRAHRDQISPALRDLLEMGRTMRRESHEADMALLRRLRAGFADVLPEHAVLLTPSAPGPAPHRETGTGSPVFNRLWTLLGAPCVTVPLPGGVSDLPQGLQVVGAPHDDHAVLAAAAWLEQRFR
ncbi:amidase [Roseospira marina]|uniref:Amidase n=1 Tax=Roseospira marina TaxID=140057 RepID=A0A5M6IAR9_9PROT|nr:amidase [Roseospira marina]KAA5605323.1 amidase [Roseospira marina]MBB4314794.1 amidase [Roseospira marina]MBB5087783.1 amidase [Roseospira marina]